MDRTKVNFVEQINYFNRYMEDNPLPPIAQLLWFKLFDIYNRSGWKEEFQADNFRLTSLIGVGSQKTFINYRQNLVDAGLIEFTPGHKRCPSKYKIIRLIRNEYGEIEPEKQCNFDSVSGTKTDEIQCKNDNVSDSKNEIGCKNYSVSDSVNDTINQNEETFSVNSEVYLSSKLHPYINNKPKQINNSVINNTLTSTNVDDAPVDENKTKKKQTKQERIDWEFLRDYWNDHCNNMRRIKGDISEARKKKVRSLLKQKKITIDDLTQVIDKAAMMPFLNGGGSRGWRANFDFILKPEKFQNIVENYYDMDPVPQNRGQGPTVQQVDDYLDAIADGSIPLFGDYDGCQRNDQDNKKNQTYLPDVVFEVD